MEEDKILKLKQNELKFQDAKYGKTPLISDIHFKSVEDYENTFFKPIQEGGIQRGELFRRTVNILLDQDVRGKRILDYACGRGDLAVYLAQKGAIVSGFDVSPNAISVAKVKAEVNQLDIDFNVMDAAALDFATDEFDFVIGIEALHHVIILPHVPQELKRIVKPQGQIVFGENWGFDNPFFQFWRESTTLRRGSSADRGEVILGHSMLEMYLADEFKRIEVEPLSLLYMSKKYVRSPRMLTFFYKVDRFLLRLAPMLENYCGESVIHITNL